MTLVKSPYSGSSIGDQIPCTSSDGRLCEIFKEHVSRCNEFFYPALHELVEQSAGELSLVGRDAVSLHPRHTREHARRAAALLPHLLARHRCVVSVDLCEYMITRDHRLVCDALRHSPNIRKLGLAKLATNECASRSFAAVLPHLDHLRELTLEGFDSTLYQGISDLLVSTASLTTLTIGCARVECADTVRILEGLKQNTTITSLSIDTSMLRHVCSPPTSLEVVGDMFADYLRDNKLLRTLSIYSHLWNATAAVRRIVEALFCNDTLAVLQVIDHNFDRQTVDLVSELLSRNDALTTFDLLSKESHWPAPDYGDDSCVLSDDIVSCRIRPWIVALTENKTLTQMSLDLSWFNECECLCLFRAVASKECLRTVNVTAVRHEDMREILQALRDIGVEKRFHFSEECSPRDLAVALTHSSPCITIDTSAFQDNDALVTSTDDGPSLDHVTSISVQMNHVQANGGVCSRVARFIASASSLRALTVHFCQDDGAGNAADCVELVLKVLSESTSIRKLLLDGVSLTDTEERMMADILQSTRTICDVSFHPHADEADDLLIRVLSPNISRNYTLLRFSVPLHMEVSSDWFAVADVARRNSSLVVRAAHFVMGKRRKYGAEALELVHFNPALVEKVQELASVDEVEAVLRIKGSLKSFYCKDGFMSVAGVVRESVTCHERDDGQVQLVDLDADCWSHIRQYLKVGDIRDSCKP